jgi:hypothetical protein
MATAKRKATHAADAPPAKSTRSASKPTPTPIQDKQRVARNARQKQARAQDSAAKQKAQEQAAKKAADLHEQEIRRAAQNEARRQARIRKKAAKEQQEKVLWQDPVKQGPAAHLQSPTAPTPSPITPPDDTLRLTPIPSSLPIIDIVTPDRTRSTAVNRLQDIALPFSSSPVRALEYNVAIATSILVNSKRVCKTEEPARPKSEVTMEWMETKVDFLISLPSSTVDGRPHTILSRSLSFKTDRACALFAWIHLTDFSEEEGSRLWALVDSHVRWGGPGKFVELRIEVRVKCEAQARAFPRTAVDLLSDPPVLTPAVSRTCTNQLLRKNNAMDKAEKIWEKT